MLGGHFGASQTPHLGRKAECPSSISWWWIPLQRRVPAQVLLSQLTDIKQVQGYQALLWVVRPQTGKYLYRENINILNLLVNQLKALCSEHIVRVAAAFQKPGRCEIPAWLPVPGKAGFCIQPAPRTCTVNSVFLWEPAAERHQPRNTGNYILWEIAAFPCCSHLLLQTGELYVCKSSREGTSSEWMCGIR